MSSSPSVTVRSRLSGFFLRNVDKMRIKEHHKRRSRIFMESFMIKIAHQRWWMHCDVYRLCVEAVRRDCYFRQISRRDWIRTEFSGDFYEFRCLSFRTWICRCAARVVVPTAQRKQSSAFTKVNKSFQQLSVWSVLVIKINQREMLITRKINEYAENMLQSVWQWEEPLETPNLPATNNYMLLVSTDVIR